MNLLSIPANPVPDGVVSGLLKTRDGVALRFARWAPPPGRKGTVCLFQGRAEFIEKYFETVRDLRERGFAVATLDWRGQGLSERALRNSRKGYVRSFSQYQIDLETFINEVVLRTARRRCSRWPTRWARPCSCVPPMPGTAGSIAWCCSRR